MRTEFDPVGVPDLSTLERHLEIFLGAWPSSTRYLTVAESTRRTEPSWDGSVQSFVGVVEESGRGVLSVPPGVGSRIARVVEGIVGRERSRLRELPSLILGNGGQYFEGIFRYCLEPSTFPEVGTWLPAQSVRVPAWLKPFGGQVLLALDDQGEYLGGVGIKNHTPYGRELAVVTEEAARGRGIARALVAQAAARVLFEGAVPIYLHREDNVASAKVAEAVGFSERGWRVLGMGPGRASTK